MQVCVLASTQKLFSKAQLLADELLISDLKSIFIPEEIDGNQWRKEIKRLAHVFTNFQAALLLEEKGLSLLPLVKDKQQMSPIFIDFTEASWERRLFNISSKTELAGQALGLNKKDEPVVFDANAGLGQDSFVFAALGAKVLCCERSPLAYCLLLDALQRAKNDSRVSQIAQRIELIKDDAIIRIAHGDVSHAQSLYLDPMFPEKKQQALAKKEMQVFQQLIGADHDAEQLIQAALDFLVSSESCKRVVLKRPRLAPVLFSEKLGRQVEGNSTRFDIYFKS